MKVTYRIFRHWSLDDAEFKFDIFRYTDWGDCVTVVCVASGDERWANTNAEHLGVEIEDEPDIGVEHPPDLRRIIPAETEKDATE